MRLSIPVWLGARHIRLMDKQSSSPQNVALRVTEHGSNVKLFWSGCSLSGSSWTKTYCVNRQMLHRASQAVRSILQTIATAYISPTASYIPYYRQLADEAQALRGALFTDENNQPMAKLLSHLEQYAPSTPLFVFSDGCVQVPWNFVLFGDPDDLPPPEQMLSDFDQFWSTRFKITTRFATTEFPPPPVRKNNLRTLLVLHAKRHEKAVELLASRYPEIQPKLKELLAFKAGVQQTWEDCRKSWRTMSEHDSILYIFAHSDGASLHLKDDDEDVPLPDQYRFVIDTNKFRTHFTKPQHAETHTLCFINGCRTADGSFGDGFQAVTSGNGFHGFIGSEAEISSDWAARYAVEFLYSLIIESKPLREVYDELRSRCFPLSLWYSCCAEPSFRVTDA